MKTAQFLKLLTIVRRADDALGETLAEISLEVLEQFHLHGNKTPHLQLMLAVDGGVDVGGLFGTKGEQLRGVSKGVASLFAGIHKLGKRDENADCEVLATIAVDAGMKTRADASAEAKAKREHAAKVKAKADKAEADKAETTTATLILCSGAGIKLTPAEVAMLQRVLAESRDMQAAEEQIVVGEVIDMPEMTRLIAA